MPEPTTPQHLQTSSQVHSPSTPQTTGTQNSVNTQDSLPQSTQHTPQHLPSPSTITTPTAIKTEFTTQQAQTQQAQQPQSQTATATAATAQAPTMPRVLEYNPHFGPEGQTFTVTLQSNVDRQLRIGFGTLVVETRQYSANGYITLSCIVPNFAITKWFVNKVPLYVLQMENDLVLESWPFGDYTYYDSMPSTNMVQQQSNKRQNPAPIDTMAAQQHKNLYGDLNQQSPKKTHIELGLPMHATQPQAQPNQLGPLPSSSSLSSLAGRDDYGVVSAASQYDALYQSQPQSPYGSRPQMPTSSAYARPATSNYYGANQILAPQISSYSQSELSVPGYTMTNNSYLHGQAPPAVTSSYVPPAHASATSIGSSLPLASYNPYASLLNKANLKFQGNMEDMAINWNTDEWESHRRLVQFWRRQEGNDIHCSFAPVAPAERQPNSIVVSCIYWAEKNDCFLTSVDCIYLLESLIAVRFTVEEKNRIRRNLEGFRPITVSKCKPESAEFFKLIMSFPNPKPRNIEKDVKVFPWKVLPFALKKIISKYTASYSSTASIQTDAFHNANFPNGSTLPITPQQQQTILESSLIV
ncbi:hypothetical protein DFQ27_009955 [Actinomortierella ambigua]|uniref:DUF7082 domain-containing protein n=1 Tax=Actinomortierella ambigua TaxID=1343610 RepID=A0A9P6QEL7_9FUNG|nr:hypothetical protein DFQ27_009955 [Actinomortierella ambigua]